MTQGPRTAILHPDLQGSGGSEGTAAWLAEALKESCRVSLVSMGPIDLARLDTIYGTRLGTGRVETVSLPIPKGLERRFDALRSHRLGRWAKARAGEFDVMISSYNVMDFGRRGIQYIADFSFDDGLRRSLHPAGTGGLRGAAYRKTPLRSLYLRLGRALSRQSEAGWRRNVTYANSAWAKKALEERLGLESAVLYPPVPTEFAAVPWEERENGFVVLARLAPEKQVERAMAVLAEVRQAGHDIHLHILGREDGRGYAERIRRLCRESGGWARLEGFAAGDAKRTFLAGHRYGISGCRNEAFGIGVAEMVAAGCVAWVPRGGGQVEIVAHDGLIFENDGEAASKIAATLADPGRQSALRRHLAGRAEAFSTARFVEASRRAVEGFLNGGRR